MGVGMIEAKYADSEDASHAAEQTLTHNVSNIPHKRMRTSTP